MVEKLQSQTHQPAQSFKSRGIGLFIREQLRENPSARFAIASSGNAALACSCACATLGAKCNVYLPNGTPQSVVNQLESDGALVKVIGSEYYDALNAAKDFVASNDNAIMVPAFDHKLIWEGHATMMPEIKRQLESRLGNPIEPAAVCCSVGGGGLFAGCLLGAQKIGWRKTRFLVAETLGADALHQTLVANKDNPDRATNPKIVTLASITSKASSLGSRSPGVEITKMSYAYDTRPASFSDEMAQFAAIHCANEEKLEVEIACGAALCFAYFPEVLRQAIPNFGQSALKSPPHQFIQPSQDRENIVYVVCGCAKVSTHDLVAWCRQLELEENVTTLNEKFIRYKVGL